MTTHIFLDTETTGLGQFSQERRKDQIIEIAFIWKQGDRYQTIQEKCNPGIEYLKNADEALRVQKRTLAEVISFPPIEKVASNVKNRIMKLTENEVEFHAWNIPFDKFFVEQEPWNLKLNWGEDPMVLASRDMGFNYDRIALWKEVKHYTIQSQEILQGNVSGFHSALYDAYMAMLIYEKIKESD